MGGIALEKADKKRANLTMTGLYVNLLDRMVEDGMFLDYGEIFRESLRRTFRVYGLKPFYIAGEIEVEVEEIPEDVESS